ncbi:MAG: D-2-hydroxyacid dehydrogenase [Muribaculaceae bacterium]|nr:D-2-hydroxyacid dehydrogenase [Muribaculaceae bacterium]
MKIVILDAFTTNPGDLSWSGIQALGDCAIFDRTAPSQVVERCAGAEAVLTNKVVISAETMNQLPALKYIGVMATGYNIVDIAAAAERGIIVTNVPAYSTASVAQIVFAHLLNVAHKVQAHSDAVHRGEWANCADFTFQVAPTTELAGMRMGIVGLGQIGSAVARIALAFGMRVSAFTSKPQNALPDGVEKVSLNELFATSDVLSLHCPLTPDTKHLVNAERISAMKPNAIIINTGRGPLVNEHDLAQALNNHRIAAACVDVLSQEPPEPSNPLLTAQNCFITPHIAWASQAARIRLIAALAQNLQAYISGNPINKVN